MTLQIEFTPREEAWLISQAALQGVSPGEIIRRMIDERLSETMESAAPQKAAAQPVGTIDAKNAAAIALMDSWLAEGAGADAETRRQAEQELDEFKRNMNANRAATGERLVFP